MKCTHCGAYIPDGELRCMECGAEVQMVPDYNPLEDVLAKQVKGSIDGTTEPLNDIYDESYRGRNPGRVRERNTGDMRRNNTGRMRRTDPEMDRRMAEERRRQMIARKRRRAQVRRRKILLTFFFLILLALVGSFAFYQNSYGGTVNKGNRALASGNLTEAQDYFQRAISKNAHRADAYTGLAGVYQAQDDIEGAEAVFTTVLETQGNNVELYRAAIEFYIATKQMEKISVLMDNCDSDTVLAQLSEYISDPPEFSLEEGTYDDVQQVSLTSSGEAIYYTTDGSDPSTLSTRYTDAILLSEGTTQVKAISVNEQGVPSLPESYSYTIELPIADSPAVTPSTGQYDTDTQIVIQVPEGYTAYYTVDGSDPSSASIQYTGPISMPEGQTIFSAVLIDESGRMTQITKRNYVLEY